MAKIEMDISEYEVMKENKKLLENSLEKERGLQEQIKKLTEEKMKALEDAKMRVVKISKTEVTEHLLRKREDTHIWRELWHLMGVDYRELPKMPEFIHTDHLAKVFFEKATSYSRPQEETTTHGLDEIKAEIRADLASKIDSDTKKKIENAELALVKNSELIKENKTLTTENLSLTESNKKLVEQCDNLSKQLVESDKDKTTLILKVLAIKEALSTRHWLFGKSIVLNKILGIVSDN